MTTARRGLSRTQLTGWFLTTATSVVLLFGYHTSTGSVTTAPETAIHATASGGQADAATPVDQTAGSSRRASTTAGGSAAGAGANSPRNWSSGTFTGSAVQTRYGPVQVEVTLRNGSITDVAVLQYPHSSGQDQQINGYALPILVQQTVEQQSGSVDMVSGATYTSTGYQQSLQSALDAAQA